MGTYTTNLALYKPTVGETGWGTLVNTNWDLLDAASLTTLLRGTLSGCQLSNNGGSPNTKIDISAGVAQDSANAGTMVVTAIIKDISAVWAVGTNGGGRGTGVPLSTSTWYHVFVIKRTDTGVVDAYFDTSASAANIPSPYTWFRRVGSVKTDGSSNLIAFTQDGDDFMWQTPVVDLSAGGSATAVSLTVSTPLGVRTKGLFQLLCSGGGVLGYVSDLANVDLAPSITVSPLAQLGNATTTGTGGLVPVHTNTSSQIRYRNSSASGTFYLATYGWVDTRGRFA